MLVCKTCIYEGKSSDWQTLSELTDHIREAVILSEGKSTRRLKNCLDSSQSNIWRVFCASLALVLYKLQLLQFFSEEDKVRRAAFCEDISS
jgi:hypothetical protein